MHDQILPLTKELISIPSVKGEYENLQKALAVAERYLEGFTVERFERERCPSILVYKEDQRPEHFRYILNAHLDVVPGHADQYNPVEQDGKLYGRGAIDMKAAAAVEILVFAEIARSLPYPIGLQLVTDEENAGFHGTKYQVEKGVRTEFVIAGEPTDFHINNKTKGGPVWIKITTTGKPAHAAYVWQGKNAINAMNEVITALTKHYPVPTQEAWKTTINVARISTSNDANNKVPDLCELYLDIRYLPEDENWNPAGPRDVKYESIISYLRHILPADLNVDIKILQYNYPLFTPDAHPDIEKLKNATEKIRKDSVQLVTFNGNSDVRYFNEVGCDGVCFGPCGWGLHTDEEYVEVASLGQYYDILKEFLTPNS
jgi:succinyl-diaminopimelate desuccinylase